MNIAELENRVGNLSIFGISDADFSILKNPHQAQSIILHRNNEQMYEVYFFDEHEEKDSLQTFESEAQACGAFYLKILDLCAVEESHIKYLIKNGSIKFVKPGDFFEYGILDSGNFSKGDVWALSKNAMTEEEYAYIKHVFSFGYYKHKPQITEEKSQIMYVLNKMRLRFSREEKNIYIPKNIFYKEANKDVFISDSMRSKIVEDIKIAMFGSGAKIVNADNEKPSGDSIIYLK